MSWSAPFTAVSNTAYTAAQHNASVRDNMLETPADLDEETDAHLAAAAGQRNVAAQIGRLIAGAGPVSLDDLGISLADDGTIQLGKVS